MWIRHSCGDVKLEVRVIIDLIVTDFNADIFTYLNSRFI
jgi:hypothetical protein